MSKQRYNKPSDYSEREWDVRNIPMGSSEKFNVNDIARLVVQTGNISTTSKLFEATSANMLKNSIQVQDANNNNAIVTSGVDITPLSTEEFVIEPNAPGDYIVTYSGILTKK